MNYLSSVISGAVRTREDFWGDVIEKWDKSVENEEDMMQSYGSNSPEYGEFKIVCCLASYVVNKNFWVSEVFNTCAVC